MALSPLSAPSHRAVANQRGRNAEGSQRFDERFRPAKDVAAAV